MNYIESLAAKESVKAQLMGIPGVVGVGIGRGSEDMINVYVKARTADMTDIIPSSVSNIPIRIIETGELKALPLLMSKQLPQSMDLSRTSRMRPARPGCSVGHIDITAGTFGAVAIDNDTGRRVILSNTHVMNPDPRKSTMPRYDLLQPGAYDSGTEDDKIADVLRWSPLSVTELNLTDCAIAMPVSDYDISGDTIDIGPITGTAVAQVGEMVRKSGRTSGLTQAPVIDISADVTVGYEDSEGMYFEATFTDQIVTEFMASPGDSGSLLVNADNRAVGLLFAGSDKITIHNKIQNVEATMGISLGAGTGGTVPPQQTQAGLSVLLMLGLGFTALWWMLKGR